MILAGIDEAGYGSLLGPMVVGCAAFEFDAPAHPLPDGWTILRRLVSRTRDPSAKRLHVNDSKKVYSPAGGLRELERSVLSLAASMGREAMTLDDFLCKVAPTSAVELDIIEWYRRANVETYPLANSVDAIKLSANFAKVELERADASIKWFASQVVTEVRLNRMFATLRNKAATSFQFVVEHIADLLLRFSTQDLVIVCDRQGGRTYYANLLRQMFGDWTLTVIREGDERSEYQLTNGIRTANLIFAEKAESIAISVAVASMLCKYLREALMQRFNAYWCSRVPSLRPTAGYWEDGKRFLRDIAVHADRLQIEVESLARTR